MVDVRESPTLQTIPFLIAACLFAFSANAQYSGGTGEPNDPYQIATAADLIALGATPEDYDKHFILTADIDLDPNLPGRKVFDKAVIAPDTDPDDTWRYWGYFTGTRFTGVLDGNGYRVLHLTIKGSGYLGLFGLLASPAEVRGVGMVGVSITASGDYVGALAGHMVGGTISGCYSTGCLFGDTCVGGLVGRNGMIQLDIRRDRTYEVGGDIDDCYSTCSVTGTATLGGLVGFNHVGLIAMCYSTGSVRGSEKVGGLLGQNDAAVVSCFWDVETSGLTVSAGGVGQTTAAMWTASTFPSWGACGQLWTLDEGRDYPHLAWENLPGVGIAGPTYGGGAGTQEDPYLIYTAEQLNVIGLSFCDRDKHFKLMMDVDVSSLDGKEGRAAFNIIGVSDLKAFAGVFDGNGHTISRLTIAGGGDLGLFGYLASGADIKDLGVVDVNIASHHGAGGLVMTNRGTVARCYSTGTVDGNNVVGGLVGNNYGTLIHCYSTCTVSGSSYIGGLVGYNSSDVSQCYCDGVVRGTYGVGGLVGWNVGGLTHCYSAAAVHESGGGLVGGDWVSAGPPMGGQVRVGVATECFWDIQTSGQTYSLNRVGKTTREMWAENTFICWAADGVWTIDEGRDYPRLWWENALGHAISRDYYYGGGRGTHSDPYLIYTAEQLNMIGLIPCDRDKHFKLMADIDLSGLAGVEFNVIGSFGGPFAGVFDGNGHVISHLTSSTGLFGDVELGGEVRDLGVVDVNITAQYSAGGLVVYNSGTLTQCYSTGAVRSTGSTGGHFLVGGLVASNSGTVTRCYSKAAVSDAAEQSYVGGLVGSNYATVTQCYTAGAVSGKSNVGGLIGYNPGGDVIRCYSMAMATAIGKNVGGLVGYNGGGRIRECYSTGRVSGVEPYVGGLVGMYTWPPEVMHCFWDARTSGQTTGLGGPGKTTAEMQMAKTFLDAGWDFMGETANGTEDIWWIDEGKDYPRLWWERVPDN